MVLLLLACAALQDPVVLDPGDTLVRWYDVEGSTVAGLRESLRATSPRNPDGEHVNAQTEWSITWRWDGDGEPCRVTRAVVDTSIVVWMPRWTPGRDTDPGVVDRWRTYLAALFDHEQGHVDRVRDGAATLPHALRGAACDEIDAVGNEALGAIRFFNGEYDAVTGHGVTQGARFWTDAQWGAALDDTAPYAP